jgi:hypothetical protein
LLDYSDIEFFTRVTANRIAGITDLKIKFSNSLIKYPAVCHWDEVPKEIYFSKKFIDLNINTKHFDTIIEELVVHECVHLLHGYHLHDEKFEKCCRKHGVEPYGYSVPVIEVRPTHKTICSGCSVNKLYYKYPKNLVCKKCGGKLNVRTM